MRHKLNTVCLEEKPTIKVAPFKKKKKIFENELF